MSKQETSQTIHTDLLDLTASSLYAFRMETGGLPVLGEGSLEASIVFVGEAPGKREAATGRPFCGASGNLLNTLLEGVGLDRTQVYITNIVKDRPPENRDPTPAEIALYGPLLDRQLALIQPRVIAPLGRFAMQYILAGYGVKSVGPISELHGHPHVCQAPYGEVLVIPLYHPAVALYNRTRLPELQADMQVVASAVQGVSVSTGRR